MAYSGHNGPNATIYTQNLNAGFSEYQQEPDGQEEDLSRFVVEDWSTKPNYSAAADPEPLQGWEGFDESNPLFPSFDTSVPHIHTQPAFPHRNDTVLSDYFPQFQESPTLPTNVTFEASSGQQATSGDGSFTLSPEDSEKARKAADEDKRRRNTAASARFRHKKKDQERQMHQKVQAMATEIAELRMKVETLKVEKKALEKVLALRDQHSGGSDVKEESASSEGPRGKRARSDN